MVNNMVTMATISSVFINAKLALISGIKLSSELFVKRVIKDENNKNLDKMKITKLSPKMLAIAM